MFVSCWYTSDHESAAMWKLYARTSEAIAVESTFGHLRVLLPGDSTARRCVYIGMVKYLDYEAQAFPQNNVYWPFVHKRLSFAHERELRAIVQEGGAGGLSTPNPDPGITIPVELEKLIRRVWVAPDAPGWFFELVKSVCSRYGVAVEVRQSKLGQDPVY
jgi:hypothetical protein